MSNPFPFQPFEDSLFGESLLKAWIELGFDKEALIHNLNSFCNNVSSVDTNSDSDSQSEFFFTKNTTKELLLNSLPGELRICIQSSDSNRMNQLLAELARGNLEHQSYPGLDVLFEILEWILTGFEDPRILTDILVFILPELSIRIKEEAGFALVEKIDQFYRQNFLTK